MPVTGVSEHMEQSWFLSVTKEDRERLEEQSSCSAFQLVLGGDVLASEQPRNAFFRY